VNADSIAVFIALALGAYINLRFNPRLSFCGIKWTNELRRHPFRWIAGLVVAAIVWFGYGWISETRPLLAAGVTLICFAILIGLDAMARHKKRGELSVSPPSPNPNDTPESN
jgi:hypothetical protein